MIVAWPLILESRAGSQMLVSFWYFSAKILFPINDPEASGRKDIFVLAAFAGSIASIVCAKNSGDRPMLCVYPFHRSIA